MKRLLFTFCFLATYSTGFAQLTVTAGPDTNQIRNQLQGNGVQIYGFSFYADTISYGLFQGTSELPLTSGFAITTGNVNHMAGHCDSVLADSALFHDALGWSEIVDVDSNAVYDYNRLSFSVITVGDTLKIGFCFASEDYLRMYNDVGAIMISGPNPAGGQYDSVRLSWIANASFPVCVMNCNLMVWQAYFNAYSYIPAQNESYTGGTIVLERKIAVVPGQPYYISFSVADANDRNYDSALLVEGLWSDSTLAVTENSLSGISLYPNPASDVVTFKTGNSAVPRTLTITDQLGRMVWYSEENNNVIAVPVDDFSNGVYYYTVEDGSDRSHGKFVVNH